MLWALVMCGTVMLQLSVGARVHSPFISFYFITCLPGLVSYSTVHTSVSKKNSLNKKGYIGMGGFTGKGEI